MSLTENEWAILRQRIEDALGGGLPIGVANPLQVSDSVGSSRVIQAGEVAGTPGGYPASRIYYGNDDNGKVDADTIWVNVDDAVTYACYAELVTEVGQGYAQVYSRLAFLYPEAKWKACFPTLAATPGSSRYLGFENGPASPKGLVCFVHAYSGGADHIYAYLSNTSVEITALVPADWKTVSHFWEIKVNPLSADFFVDNVLVCTATEDRDIPAVVSQLGAYRSHIVPQAVDRSKSPLYAEFIAIEGSVPATPVHFPVSKIYHTVVEGETDRKPRLYLLATVANLAATGITGLSDCLPLHGGEVYALTITLTYAAAAAAGARIHVKTSYDGTTYDSALAAPNTNIGDLDRWDMDFLANTTFTQTKFYSSRSKFTKILVENLDAAQAITNISIRAQVKG